jgi:hypothetical protein
MIASMMLAAIAQPALKLRLDFGAATVSGVLNTADNCQSSGDGTTPRGVPAPNAFN